MAATQITLPTYSDDTEQWLLLVEAILNNTSAEVTDQQKFGALLGALPTSKVKDVESVLANPPRNDKCKALLTALKKNIRKQSDECSFTELLSMQLGDSTPSSLLTRMNRLNDRREAKLPPEVIRSLHLQKMPATLQALIETAGMKLEDGEYAETADNILRRHASAQAVRTGPAHLNVIKSQQNVEQEAEIKRLQQQVRELQDLVKKQRSSASSDNNNGICYYHRQFGNRARNCQQPCSYQGNYRGGRW